MIDKADIKHIEKLLLAQFRISRSDRARGACHLGKLIIKRAVNSAKVILCYNEMLDFESVKVVNEKT